MRFFCPHNIYSSSLSLKTGAMLQNTKIGSWLQLCSQKCIWEIHKPFTRSFNGYSPIIQILRLSFHEYLSRFCNNVHTNLDTVMKPQINNYHCSAYQQNNSTRCKQESCQISKHYHQQDGSTKDVCKRKKWHQN